MLVGLLLLQLLVPSITNSTVDLDEVDEVLCDDGSAPFNEDGEPNWSCSKRGCTPSAGICWEEQLAECKDETGGDNGECTTEIEECHSRWSCFELWAECLGMYECLESGGLGCLNGTCETNMSPETESEIIQ